MGKTGKWLKSLLTGKKAEKENSTIKDGTATNITTTLVGAVNPTTPISNRPTTPKEKKRWSFRRSSANNNNMSGPLNLNSIEAVSGASTLPPAVSILETELTQVSPTDDERFHPHEQAAAIMIQSTFRSYLVTVWTAHLQARKALRALRALVKLQALVRGHLVRKQAKATLRCMQALLTVQARVRAQRIQMAAGDRKPADLRQSPHRRGHQEQRARHSYNDVVDKNMEENVKIVEMDVGESRGSTKSRKSYSNYSQVDPAEHRYSSYSYNPPYSKQDEFDLSPAPSAITEISPRVCSGHFEDNFFNTAQSSPQYNSYAHKSEMSEVPFTFHQPMYAESLNYDYSLFPNYMANTESSRAKARSQSAPKCRPESSYERQPNRRRPSIEGRNVPRGMKMQRSSSQVGASVQGYNYPPWANIKLDQSNASLKASECGSTSTVLTTNTYCRSVTGYDMSRHKEYITQQL